MAVSITQLEYIVAVDQHRSFSLAAEACFVTQPTLSMQIKKLEEQLGVVVFDRGKQPVVPTEVGAALIAQARRVLQENAKLEQIVLRHQGKVSGELKVGIIPTLAPYLLPLFIGPLSRDYPDIQLQVQELQTSQIISALKKDLIDVGILVTPLQVEGIGERPLFYEEIMVYLNPAHPLARLRELHPSDLEQPGLWLMSQGHCFREQVLNICHLDQEGQAPIAYESGSLETLRKLVDRQGGFTLMPELAFLEMPEEAQEHIRTFSGVRPMREVALAYSRNMAKASLLDALAASILEGIPPFMRKQRKGDVVAWH